MTQPQSSQDDEELAPPAPGSLGYFPPPPAGFTFDPNTADELDWDRLFIWGEMDHRSNIDADEFEDLLRCWGASLIASDDGVEYTIAHALIYEMPWMRWTDQFYARLDAEHVDLDAIAAALSTSAGRFNSRFLGDEPMIDDLIVVEHVHVHPDYRGRRLSHRLVEWAIARFDRPSLVVLNPMPTEGPRTSVNIRGLQRHWRRAGFERLASGIYGRTFGE